MATKTLKNTQAEPAQTEEASGLPTPEQVRLLQDSFAKLAPRGEAFVARFYENLFEFYPATRLLFEEARFAMTQKQVLNSLVLAIQGLQDPETLAPVLMQLGARHIRYGVLPSYLPMFERAAMATLKEFLSTHWNGELERAWATALRTVVVLMQQGLSQAHLHGDHTESHRRGPAARDHKAAARTPWHTRLALGFLEAPLWMLVMLGCVAVGALFYAAEDSDMVADVLDKSQGVAVVVAMFMWLREIPVRKREAIFDAFQTVDASRGARTSPARVMALESLAADRVSLKGMDLAHISLAGIRLKGVDLAAASLVETDLQEADLTEANFLEANLVKAQLAQADLRRARLSFANLSGADLTLANLEGADLTCAVLANANLSGANLKGAKLAGSEVRKTSLVGANLLIADLTGVELTNVDLRGAIMPDGRKVGDSGETPESV